MNHLSWPYAFVDFNFFQVSTCCLFNRQLQALRLGLVVLDYEFYLSNDTFLWFNAFCSRVRLEAVAFGILPYCSTFCLCLAFVSGLTELFDILSFWEGTLPYSMQFLAMVLQLSSTHVFLWAF